MEEKEKIEEYLKELKEAYMLDYGEKFDEDDIKKLKELLKDPYVQLIYELGYTNGYESF